MMPLAIVQARIGSTRLPGKMLLPLAGKPLVWHAWNAAVKAFGAGNVVCALPASQENDQLASVLVGLSATVFRWAGPENDVLGRFHACAHRYRWHPDSVIVRVTPDDPRKDAEIMSRHLVACGQRVPVELGGEAFTLAMLDDAERRLSMALDSHKREHLTHALFPYPPPPPPPGVWTVDTQEDYEAMRKVFGDA